MSSSWKDGTNWNAPEDRPMLLALGSFLKSAGVTQVAYGGARGQALVLPDAATETLYANVPVPIGWTVAKVSLVWTIGTGTAGQVCRIFINSNSFGDTDNSNVADTQVTIDLTAPVADIVKDSVISSAVAVTAGKMLRFRIARDGAHANDTLAGTCLVLMVKIEKVR